jgi:hypothetical protein
VKLPTPTTICLLSGDQKAFDVVEEEGLSTILPKHSKRESLPIEAPQTEFIVSEIMMSPKGSGKHKDRYALSIFCFGIVDRFYCCRVALRGTEGPWWKFSGCCALHGTSVSYEE